jgi:hypothetical protein
LKLCATFTGLREVCGYTKTLDVALSGLPTRYSVDCGQRPAIEVQRGNLEKFLRALAVEGDVGSLVAHSFLRPGNPSCSLLADPIAIPSYKTLGAGGRSKRRGDPLKEGIVLRARWESYWREEWAILYDSQIRFIKSNGRSPAWKIETDQIIGVKAIQKESGPVVGENIYFFEIETPSFVTYIGVASDSERDDWIRAIKEPAHLNNAKVGMERLNTAGMGVSYICFIFMLM